MGKPFQQEIEKITSTYRWIAEQPVNELRKHLFRNKDVPLYIVGSGGSLSACHLAVALYQRLGVMAKAVTPLEIYHSREAIRGSKVLFISASGKNSDILFAFNTVIVAEPLCLTSLCMKQNTKLSMLSKKYSAIAKTIEYDLPTGRDGFLATNSLIAYFQILLRTFGCLTPADKLDASNSFKTDVRMFLSKVSQTHSYMVLYGGLGQPVAVDLESKFVEAALGDISISDYRNFAHGRHHWFAKRGDNSAIIAIVTPSEKLLAEKTLALLPKTIPILYIPSEYNSEFAALDLLVKSFQVVNEVGQFQGIDPGRPGVPDYGSKLYNLKYANTLQRAEDPFEKIVLRKANCRSVHELSADEYSYWKGVYNDVSRSLRKTNFGAVVFDYDGTLCSSEDRFKGVTTDVIKELKRLLKGGFIVGIATGRGKSVREVFQKSLPKKLWKNFVIAYYNGSDIAMLDDNTRPETKHNINDSLKAIHHKFTESDFPMKLKSDLRPNQLTIELPDSQNWHRIKPIVLQTVKLSGYTDIEILESTHSIDIVVKPNASKLHLISFCKDLLKKASLPQNILTIGDKGQWPGNDYELLSHPHSLSVDEVSPLPYGAWNLARPGVRNIDALIEYLKRIEIKENKLKLKIK